MENVSDDYLLGLKNGGMTQKEIADTFNLTVGQVAGRIRRIRKSLSVSGLDHPITYDEFVESVEIREDGTQVSDKLILISEEERKNPRRLMELHGYDPDAWAIINAVDNLWHGQRSWRKGGGLLLHYQSKITVKPLDTLNLEAVDRFFAEFDGVKAQPVKPSKYDPNGGVLEINLADLHSGKDTPYDRKKIGDTIRHTIDDIWVRCNDREFSKIYLVLNGDTFHFDTKKRTTTAGTPLTTNGITPFELFDDVASMLMWVIDTLVTIAPVEVIVIPGNHDWLSSYMLAKSLDFYYEDDQNILVDTSHKPRKWRIIGIGLIGWMHGDMSKSNATGWLMSEAREEWGETKYAEVHAAHIHSQQSLEKNGMILRYLPSLSGVDEWHYDKGFVGSVRATVSFVYDLKGGMVEMWFTNHFE